MDAAFWTAASGSAWSTTPPRLGRPDTIARHFRRPAHAGLWERLLKALARPGCPPALLALEHRVVPACRRAARLRGSAMLVLAKRPGFPSAPGAPCLFLPEPDLSGLVERWLRRAAENIREHGPDAGTSAVLRLGRRLGRFAAGRRRLGRRFLPI